MLVMREGPAREQLQGAVEKLRVEDRKPFLADVGIAVQTIHRLCTRSAEPPVALDVTVATARRYGFSVGLFILGLTVSS